MGALEAHTARDRCSCTSHTQLAPDGIDCQRFNSSKQHICRHTAAIWVTAPRTCKAKQQASQPQEMHNMIYGCGGTISLAQAYLHELKQRRPTTCQTRGLQQRQLDAPLSPSSSRCTRHSLPTFAVQWLGPHKQNTHTHMHAPRLAYNTNTNTNTTKHYACTLQHTRT